MPHTQFQTLPFRARAGLAQRLTRFMTEVAARRRDRKALSQLDKHLLRDIGLSPNEAQTECAKPFWQP